MALIDQRLVGEITDRLARVRFRIGEACRRAGRPADAVVLVAVAKWQPVALIRAAYQAGQRDFGENYLQELAAKASALSDLEEIRWRFVGHLQRNKVRDAVRICGSVDTVDSLRLAEALNERARQSNRFLEVMIQVNLGSEEQKGGCAMGDLDSLAVSMRGMDWLVLRGLMAIPPAEVDPERSRPWFRRLRELRDGLGLPELSMGMSADLEVAVEEGATMVRVGSAIFGPRPSP